MIYTFLTIQWAIAGILFWQELASPVLHNSRPFCLLRDRIQAITIILPGIARHAASLAVFVNVHAPLDVWLEA